MLVDFCLITLIYTSHGLNLDFLTTSAGSCSYKGSNKYFSGKKEIKVSLFPPNIWTVFNLFTGLVAPPNWKCILDDSLYLSGFSWGTHNNMVILKVQSSMKGTTAVTAGKCSFRTSDTTGCFSAGYNSSSACTMDHSRSLVTPNWKSQHLGEIFTYFFGTNPEP